MSHESTDRTEKTTTDERLLDLLAGATPEVEERRLVAVVSELRASRVEAPESLRARVLEKVDAAEAGRAEPRWSLAALRLRRPLLVLAPLTAAALLAVVVVGNVDRGDPSGEALTSQEDSKSLSAEPGAESAPAQEAQESPGSRAGDQSALPGPDTSRPQDFDASMHLEVDSVEELSEGTVSAMRTARRLGGYLVSVDYHATRPDGQSRMQLAVPTARVDEALASFGDLGLIVDQSVSIRDLGQQVDDLSEQLARARAEIRRLESELRREPESDVLRAQLDEMRRTVQRLTAERGQVEEVARLASVDLTLTVQTPTPHEPGSFERALSDSWHDLEQVLSKALYLVLVLSPLWLLGAVALLWRSRARRAADRRLLERQ